MMRKYILLILFVSLSAMLSGCIISRSPSTNTVTLQYGATMNFSVSAWPSGTFTWTLDGDTLPVTVNSYTYTAEAGTHFLVVRVPKSAIGEEVQAWTIITNYPPVADAGGNQTVGENVTVTLDGSNSTDHDGDIASYAWVQTDRRSRGHPLRCECNPADIHVPDCEHERRGPGL